MQYDLLLKLLAAHFLSDFFFQRGKWVNKRNEKHFRAPVLYLHGLITALTIVVLCGIKLWVIALIIGLSHILLDGAKSYLKQGTLWFILDQIVHLVILGFCWKFYVNYQLEPGQLAAIWENHKLWLYLAAILFLTFPSGMLVGVITAKWREELDRLQQNQDGLVNAGMLIGILERLLIFVLFILARYEIIGFLIAAKTLLRFNEKERPEAKTEYLLIGTLISVGLAIGTGFIVTLIKFNQPI